MKTFPTRGVLRELDSGLFHRILEISSDLVVKVPLSTKISLSNLQREHDTMRRLYSFGISVPKPYGVYSVVVNPELKIADPGIVMQRIYGINVELLNGDLRIKAEKLMEEELDKCRKSGFSLWDEGASNTLYCKEENKIYLIDFQDGKFG